MPHLNGVLAQRASPHSTAGFPDVLVEPGRPSWAHLPVKSGMDAAGNAAFPRSGVAAVVANITRKRKCRGRVVLASLFMASPVLLSIMLHPLREHLKGRAASAPREPLLRAPVREHGLERRVRATDKRRAAMLADRAA